MFILKKEATFTHPIVFYTPSDGGTQKEETMPTDACQYFYECTACHTILKPKEDDCCVFCSYGSVACPPIQNTQECC